MLGTPGCTPESATLETDMWDLLPSWAHLSSTQGETERGGGVGHLLHLARKQRSGRLAAPAGRGGAPAASGSGGAAGDPCAPEGPLVSARGGPRPAGHGGKRCRWPVSVLWPEERRNGGERWLWSITRAARIHRQGGIAGDLPQHPGHEPPRQVTRVTSGGGGEIGVYAFTFAWLDHPRRGRDRGDYD
jgi:hypothetical protein